MEFCGGLTVMEYCLGAYYIVFIYASQGKSKAGVKIKFAGSGKGRGRNKDMVMCHFGDFHPLASQFSSLSSSHGILINYEMGSLMSRSIHYIFVFIGICQHIVELISAVVAISEKNTPNSTYNSVL